MSAARLAAESLFSAPRIEEPKHQPLVVVRKTRSATAASAQAGQTGPVQLTLTVEDTRLPRVFRVDTAVEDAEAAVAANDEAGQMPLLPPAAVLLPVVDPKRPGPVVRIYSAPAVEPVADNVADLTFQQAQQLRGRFALLSATIAAAEHAESLSFTIDIDAALALNGITHSVRAMRAQLGRPYR